MKTGIELISAERERQILIEGHSLESDKKYNKGQLAMAAAAYSVEDGIIISNGRSSGIFISVKRKLLWPQYWSGFKPTPNDRVKELIKAGALIAAEIDRLLIDK